MFQKTGRALGRLGPAYSSQDRVWVSWPEEPLSSFELARKDESSRSKRQIGTNFHSVLEGASGVTWSNAHNVFWGNQELKAMLPVGLPLCSSLLRGGVG